MGFKEYEDPRELEKVQMLSAYVLKELDRVCTELDIPYVLWAGTALGAVRHQGFIPWDDDVDIAMLRSDYERFLELAPEILGEDFELSNVRIDPECTTPYSYLSLKGTYCIPEFFKKCKYKKPLSIDIIALDRISDDESVRSSQMNRAWFWGRLFYLRLTGTPFLPFDGWKKGLVLAVCEAAHFFLKFFRISAGFIQKKWEAAVRQCENESTLFFADFSEKNANAWSLREEEFFPLKKVRFCNDDFNIAACYEELLEREYGSYMELPPLSERKNHYPYKLDFGKFK